ncbi:hypothetical protein AB4Z25_27955 [Rhizobium sp. RAF36]|jgi:hypothetical protein|uniref:hypothetical protein n=1 Tax=Rhizobium sp. RAF36 TaxID=3233055 RepID=UPI0013AF7DDD
MRAVGFINWDKVRDWLAQAGCACSGYYADYEASRPKAHPRTHTLTTKNSSRAASPIVWMMNGREF